MPYHQIIDSLFNKFGSSAGTLRIGVLASGQGSNFQALLNDARIDHAYEVAVLISDNHQAQALERAEKAGLPHYVVDPKAHPNKRRFEAEIIKHLVSREVHLVVLAGFMRILSPHFLKQLPSRVINIHPSLLPAFPGRDSIARAWGAQVPETGVTVHVVDEGIDTGPILEQQSCAILASDSLVGLSRKIHQIEHELLPVVVRKIAQMNP